MSRSNSNTSHVLHLTSHVLARNTVLNLIGQVVPLIVALVTIPYVINGLGVERFGILSIAWIVVGYFGILDMGLGRATTKFVAEALGKGEIERIPTIVWTSLTSQLFLGILGSIILLVSTPILVGRVFKISPEFIEEAKNAFYLLSFSIPIVICSTSLRGVLEATQRFDLVNAVATPSGCLNFLLPVIGLLCGFKLPGIIILLLVLRATTIGSYLILCFRVYPKTKRLFSIDTGILRSLFSFGGWITLCSMFIPALVHLERFLIGVLLSVEALGYYTAPCDMVFRLQVIPASITLTLFPAFSAITASSKVEMERLYAGGLKYVLLVMGPVVFLIILFARDILQLWLGADFAMKTTLVFQILAIGMLINALAYMPASLLDGVGRADLRAKIYFSYVFVYFGIAWFLISKMGIVGAALAWTSRVCLDSALLFVVSWRIQKFNPITFIENKFVHGAASYGTLVGVTFFTTAILGKAGFLENVILGTCFTLFIISTWCYILNVKDKTELKRLVKFWKVKGV